MTEKEGEQQKKRFLSKKQKNEGSGKIVTKPAAKTDQL